MSSMACRLGFLLATAIFVVACNNSSFSGSGRTEKAEKAPAKSDDAEKKPADTGKAKKPETAEDPELKPGGTNDEPLDTDAVSGGDDIKPDEVVDGQEVITTCPKCLARAQILSKKAGFTASMSKTYNLGFYKIEPSRNLCDIHFMNDMSTLIDDHDGIDSLGNNQVILYCPCDCNWASKTPLPGIGSDPFVP